MRIDELINKNLLYEQKTINNNHFRIERVPLKTFYGSNLYYFVEKKSNEVILYFLLVRNKNVIKVFHFKSKPKNLKRHHIENFFNQKKVPLLEESYIKLYAIIKNFKGII